jgi:hypothetical protein
MLRFQDWHIRLEAYLASNSFHPFRYSVFDCCTFVCGAVSAMTGIDPSETFRGRYSNRKEARSILASAGGFSGIAKSYGIPEIDPLRAGRGDILQVRASVLGLKSLNGNDAIVLSDRGIVVAPPVKLLRAWHI